MPETLAPWLVESAMKDRQTITARWTPAEQRLIDGVQVREVLNVPKSNGYLTEIFRAEWFGLNAVVDQVFQVVLEPGAISAWHAHADTTDRLFVASGTARIALFDARPDSPTARQVNDFRFGTIRPALVTVPAGVFHGVQNCGSTPMTLINIVDRAYDYEDPDHWRVTYPSNEIPFRF
ncbi:MAG TPA: cupin domain-containing protein [Thermoanaerobaculia bacterium]|nr:cupin domain-containing protein [Thermoanaerobaculia bacterium]